MPLRHETSPTTQRKRTEIEPLAETTATTLPQQVQNSVPSCGQPCVSAYLQEEFQCTGPDLTCFCSQYSSEGYTLGEVAYLCLQLDCPEADPNDSIAAYNVCPAQAGAVPPTHTILTLPSTRPIVSTTFSSSARPSTAKTTSSTRHSSTGTIATTTSVAILSTSSGLPTTPTSAGSITTSGVSAAPAALQGGSTSLTGAEAAGISIAAMGCIMIAIAVVYLIACLRRRKITKVKKDRDSYDFIDNAPPRFSPFNHGNVYPRGPLGGFSNSPVELASERHRTIRPVTAPQRDGLQSYGDRTMNRSSHPRKSVSPASMQSNRSTRTTSQLLPEVPTSSQPPEPSYQPRPPKPIVLAAASTTRQKHRAPRPYQATSSLPAVPVAQSERTYRPYRKTPSDPPQFATSYTLSPDPARPPSLSLQIPRQASPSERIPSIEVLPVPPVPQEENHRASAGRSSVATSRSASSFLNYYAESSSPEICSSTPIEDTSQVRRPPPMAITITKPTYPPRAVRLSTSSDTSFESTDPDEPTPPQEAIDDRKLTPVLESPIATIRYPKVPRSSNQAVPRSPRSTLSASPKPVAMPKYTLPHPSDRNHLPPPRQQRKPVPSKTHPVLAISVASPVTPPPRATASRSGPTPSLTGSTLATTQRDDRSNNAGAAPRPMNFKPLRLEYPPPRKDSRRQESPLKGYGRVAADPPADGQDVGVAVGGEDLKSPTWAPKLAPRREGDDLFLSVTAASPMNGQFPLRG